MLELLIYLSIEGRNAIDQTDKEKIHTVQIQPSLMC